MAILVMHNRLDT